MTTATLTIKGSDNLDTNLRLKALEKIQNSTDTETLKKLAELSQLKGAAKMLKTNFQLIKTFVR